MIHRNARCAVLVLVLCLAGESGFAQNSRFSTYGFFDLEFEMNRSNNGEFGFFDRGNPSPPTFDIHHFNLMSNYQIADQDRVFGEIEFEHGANVEPDGEVMRGYGEVNLERVWFEHVFSPRLKTKIGQFLPPFGFFNLVHDATPTYLFQVLPSAYGKHRIGGSSKKRMFVKLATGVQILGTLPVGANQSLSYAAYVVNGNGAQPQSEDNNVDKGLGAQLDFSPSEGLNVGTSFYTEENDFTGSLQRLSTFVAGAKYEGDHLTGIFEFENISLNGARAFNYYFEFGYTFCEMITPMARFEFVDDDRAIRDNEAVIYSVGVNVRLQPTVILKIEDHFKTGTAAGAPTDQRFMVTLAVAF